MRFLDFDVFAATANWEVQDCSEGGIEDRVD